MSFRVKEIDWLVYAILDQEWIGDRSIEFSSIEGEHEIRAVIEDMGCRDDMSGAFFSHTAEVTLDGTMYRGCAREGWETESAEY